MSASPIPSLAIHPEVQQALSENKPVVALESTIIAHGMAYPHNVETAREVERIVRDEGAVPATIAIIGGKISIGLDDRTLEMLGTSREVKKASRRDIAVITARGLDGATTVAATMFCASLAHIPVFVTGGIGGVHRGASSTFDISADLTELARTPVAVVCAGAKSILDLPLTLEKLETYGVPVLGYGTDEFPSFYSRKSGLSLDYRVDSPEEVAAIMNMKWSLGIEGGIVVANPIPESDEIPSGETERFIEKALDDADAGGVRGKALTPYLLDRIYHLTEGRSLEANIALVKNNARIGARIAAAYRSLKK
ncbi:MAG: pseudouridine-5'-phosphate glycosidase [Vulcanimicrobiota bacterium]